MQFYMPQADFSSDGTDRAVTRWILVAHFSLCKHADMIVSTQSVSNNGDQLYLCILLLQSP